MVKSGTTALERHFILLDFIQYTTSLSMCVSCCIKLYKIVIFLISDVDVEQDQRNKVAKNGPQNGKTVWEQDNNFIGQLTSNFKQWSKEWTGKFFKLP